jgi:plasmid stabilization system protein ParE
MKFIGTWWRRNRPKAPTLFADELDAAIDEIAKDPFLGTVHEIVGGRTFRRILLRRTKQNVFYVVDEAKGVVVIYGIWGARRGRGPKL